MLRKSVSLFKLSGFEVKIHSSWIIVGALAVWSLARGYFPYQFPHLSPSLYWLMGVLGALGLFLSIILHEFGHSIVARKAGVPMRGITLFIFGGVAEMEEEASSAKSEFLMAIAGPVVSILFAIIGYAVYAAGGPLGWPIAVRAVIYYLAWINALLVAFNLLPAFPLDGGRVLRSYLWSRSGSLQRATRTASRIGSAFSDVLIVVGLISVFFGNLIGGIWWFLIGIFLHSASQQSYQQLQIHKALEGEPIRRFMVTDVIAVTPQASIEELVQDYIYKYHLKMLPVVTDSRILGCITTRQVKQIPRDKWHNVLVGDVLAACSPENSVSPGDNAFKVLSLMNRTGNSRLMVVDRDRLMGVVTLRDLLDFLALKLDLEDRGGPVKRLPLIPH